MPLTQGWSGLLPFLNWLASTKQRDLRADLIAGLTGAIVVLPQGVAFAAIAGMPPEYGLYAGMVPATVAALFGSSRHLVSGPTQELLPLYCSPRCQFMLSRVQLITSP